jgi:hypothetical protein
VTVRYFPHKLPIGYDGDHRRHVFMCDGPIREHAVQDPQALNGAFDRDSPAVSVVRLSDGRVERLVVNVEDACPSGRPELNCGDESPRQDPFDEVVELLPVGDPGERGVLSADEHAGVQHHGYKEATLTIGETERRGGSSGLDRETACIRHTGDDRIQEATTISRLLFVQTAQIADFVT